MTKGIGLILMMLALLVFAFLMMKHTQEHVAPSVLGKATLIDAPAAAQHNVDESMKKETEHLNNVDSESQQ